MNMNQQNGDPGDHGDRPDGDGGVAGVSAERVLKNKIRELEAALASSESKRKNLQGEVQFYRAKYERSRETNRVLEREKDELERKLCISVAQCSGSNIANGQGVVERSEGASPDPRKKNRAIDESDDDDEDDRDDHEESDKKEEGGEAATHGRVDQERWEANFEELLKFQRNMGHCNVPQKDPTLGSWVKRQRNIYKAAQDGKKTSKIVRERIDRLNAIGFYWGKEQVPFETRLAQLEEYKRKHGDCKVPWKHPVLGKWVSQVRMQYKYYMEGNRHAKINQDRIDSLNALGFPWVGEKGKYCREKSRRRARSGVKRTRNSKQHNYHQQHVEAFATYRI